MKFKSICPLTSKNSIFPLKFALHASGLSVGARNGRNVGKK